MMGMTEENSSQSRKIGFLLIGIVFMLVMTVALSEHETAGEAIDFIVITSFFFGAGYVSCYLIQKSRVEILKKEARSLVLHYHNYGQPNYGQPNVQPPHVVHPSQAVQVGQMPQFGNPDALIKYIEKL